MQTKATILFTLTILLFLSGFMQGHKPENKPIKDFSVKVDVDMVSLPVVVTDKMGRRITGLKKEDFSVFENGIKQKIGGFAATDEPVNVVLLLDTSESVRKMLPLIQNAAIDFVNELHPDDEVAIMSFADDTTLLQDFSIDRNKNSYGIKKTRAGGDTAVYEAVWLALEEVLKPVQARKALVLFTDGVDTASSKANKTETLELAMETRATIYCIYFNTEGFARSRSIVLGGPSQIYTYPLPPLSGTPYPGPGYPGYDPGSIGPYPGGGIPPSIYDVLDDYRIGQEYLAKLSENSGGMMFDGMTDLRNAFSQVAQELANQYSIGYYPSDLNYDGKLRKVKVKINKPGYVVRTKIGYYTKKRDETKGNAP